ncbi:MAG: 16S rRNA (guanine(527)-N(7))-methyltransferase RsmG [Prevotellaceae bacterium]|jgi:16S rRNA (guanine527-N7)-methyltransferase|nr:16S rRNA (guanine(527)-N(7))-methyltransferase RsmG [Prevotellaceae bacterium]
MTLTELARYFPDLDAVQQQRFEQLPALYAEWNSRINVVSRKDIDALEVHHILHALAIARFCRFAPGASVMDAGTGGGFPGIPLAILFPEVHFTLVDAVGKKIKVVQAITEALGLRNVTPVCGRVEQLPGRFDVVVSRAVAGLPVLVEWVWPLLRPGAPPHGIICLKGGDLTAEITAAVQKLPASAPSPVVVDIKQWFDNAFFDTKKIVYLAR